MNTIFPRLISPSTRAWLREVRQIRQYSLFDLLHGYFYARWTYLYISIGTGENRLARVIAPIARRLISLLTPHKKAMTSVVPPEEIPPGALPNVTPGGMQFAHTYHGKVVPLEAAKQLVSVKQEVRITELEKVIPYNSARDIILKNPDHIVVLDCPCRVARKNPCLPLDVCLIVGEPFAGFIAEHQPERARWISSDEAVAILQAENQRGHVHHAFFKDVMLQRFYAICNCCDCCCGALQAHRNGTPMLTSSGYRTELDLERCRGCGKCARVCQFHAITMETAGSTPAAGSSIAAGSSNKKRHAVIDPALCLGCGVCVNHCPEQAIVLHRDATRGEPLEIQRLIDSMPS